MSSPSRYVVVGAGAIGGTLAGRLAQGPSEGRPLLIARGDHGRQIVETGLRLRSPESDDLIPVPVAASADEVRLRHDDMLILATKSHQVERAITDWVDQPVHDDDGAAIGTAGELLPIGLALNGVMSETIALRYFRRVFGICVWMPAVHLVPGEVAIRIAPLSGAFCIGRVGRLADDADRALLEAVQRDWEASTFEVILPQDVMPWKYAKLLRNLGNGPQALLGAGAPLLHELHARLRQEAESVYRAHRITWISDDEVAALRRDGRLDARAVPGLENVGDSSWQSMARASGSIETDYFNGEIAYLAHRIGREAPVNELVQRLARQAAAKGFGPGSMSSKTFAELLAGVSESSTTAA